MTEADLNLHLGDILAVMREGLFVVGPTGRILMANESLARLTGYSPGELTGKPCMIFHCDACELQRKAGKGAWCRLFADKYVESKRCHIRRKDGSFIPVLKNQAILYEGERILGAVETVVDLTELDRLDREVSRLSRMLGGEPGFCGMVGRSPSMLATFELIEKAAASDAPVLLLGESGTGKELAARAIHDLGRRKNGPFVSLNCAALHESLLESELFGHVKGAFTGAHRHRRGRFEEADGGDIFLDEIGDAPPGVQVKLLRVLEAKTFERVGENAPVRADVRLITATNKDLVRLAGEGRFREDFLYRINVIPVHLPPLRRRREDIVPLTEHFLALINKTRSIAIQGLTPETMRLFMEHAWPGNVRELKSALEYAAVVAEGGRIEPGHLPATMTMNLADRECLAPGPGRRAGQTPPPEPAGDREVGGDAAERAELIKALSQAGGNKAKAARLLGVSRVTVHNRMRKHRVDVTRSIA